MTGRHWESIYRDDWWLEYVEGEADPSLTLDLKILLQRSRADRKICESLVKTREVIKSADPVSVPEDGHYYDNLHSRIMAAVNEAPTSSGLATPRPALVWDSMRGAFVFTSR